MAKTVSKITTDHKEIKTGSNSMEVIQPGSEAPEIRMILEF
jgi:hypothetical protein